MKALSHILCVVFVPLVAYAQTAPGTPPNQTKAQYLLGTTIEMLVNSGYELKAANDIMIFFTKQNSNGKPQELIACTFDIIGAFRSNPNSIKTTNSSCFALN